MLRSLASTGRILAQTFPALLAWYLGGSLVHAGVLALAAPIGPTNALAALLILPVAVLARLISYIGMFLVARRAMRTYSRMAEGDVRAESLRELASEFGRVLIASVLPFFFLYSLIGLLSADISDYARAAYRYSNNENAILNPGDGPLVIGVVVVAYAARMLLKKFGPRLPRWVAIVEIYLDATWVFVTLTGLAGIFGLVAGWISERRVVQWVSHAQETLSNLWAPLRYGIDGFEWLTPVAVQVVLLPLAWLLIAGVVYTRSLASVAHERNISPRMEATLRLRALRLPPIIRKQSQFVTDEWEDIYSPLTLAGRMIGRAGIPYLALFACSYALLFAASQWLTRGLYAAIGAHDGIFWITVDPIADLAIAALSEPVRIALLAAAFDWCLSRWARRREAVTGVPASTILAADLATDREVRDAAVATGPEPARTAEPAS